MADHLTEEEQIEAIKRWWNDNWLSVVAPIAILIGAYTVWNFWGDHKAEQAKVASDKYQSLVALFEPVAGSELEESVKNEIIALAEEIQTQHSGGMYADLSTLILARIALESGDVDLAEKSIRMVVTAPSNDSVKYVAQARLARILAQKGEYAEALKLVSTTDVEEVKALNAEIRGDIYLAQGEDGAASTAYQEALSALTQQQMTHQAILQFKLDGVNTVDESVSGDAELDVEAAAGEMIESADTTAQE